MGIVDVVEGDGDVLVFVLHGSGHLKAGFAVKVAIDSGYRQVAIP